MTCDRCQPSRSRRPGDDVAHYRLGQDDWSWAKCRLTAAQALDLRDEPLVDKYVMFYHGGPRLHRADGDSTLGLAWSDDLVHWQWGGKERDFATSSRLE
ncbi:MAG: hypothetical protein QUV05_08460 [Phycisphaerae bacterium]|jgi:hypothetical protein|nr:hypothetical protein [Phycisphaerae bacterium]